VTEFRIGYTDLGSWQVLMC